VEHVRRHPRHCGDGEDPLPGARDVPLNLDRIEVDTIEFEDSFRENDFERPIRLCPTQGDREFGVR